MDWPSEEYALAWPIYNLLSQWCWCLKRLHLLDDILSGQKFQHSWWPFQDTEAKKEEAGEEWKARHDGEIVQFLHKNSINHLEWWFFI